MGARELLLLDHGTGRYWRPAQIACVLVTLAATAAVLLGSLAPSACASWHRPRTLLAFPTRAGIGAGILGRTNDLSPSLFAASSADTRTDPLVSGTVTASVKRKYFNETVEKESDENGGVGETDDTGFRNEEASVSTSITNAPLVVEEGEYEIDLAGGVATASYKLHADLGISRHEVSKQGEEYNFSCSEATEAAGTAVPEGRDFLRERHGSWSAEPTGIEIHAQSTGTCGGSADEECDEAGECYIGEWECYERDDGAAVGNDLTGQCTIDRPEEVLTVEWDLSVGAAPPEVTTEPASDATDTSATLHASVNPEGSQVTECEFEYGPTQSYGLTAPCSPDASELGAGSDPVGVSAEVGGLQSGGTYYYKIDATNGAGTGVEGPRQFTLSPPEVGTEPAEPVEGRAAQLIGTVNSHGLVLEKCVFHLYDTATFTETEVPCEPGLEAGNGREEATGEAADLTPGTLYVYRLNASNGVAYGEGGDREFRTPGPPLVSTEGATEIAGPGASLEGSVNPNGGRVLSCAFHVFSADDPDGFDVPCVPASVGSGRAPVNVSAEASGLAPGTTYSYKLVAVNQLGVVVDEEETGEGFVLEFTTAPEPTVVTGKPEPKARSATFNGTVDPHGVDITACGFEIEGVNGPFDEDVRCDALPGSGEGPVAVSAEVTGLEPGEEYVVHAYATNKFDDRGEGEDEHFKTPGAPTVALGDADEFGSSFATVHGAVKPNGAATTCVFEYGLTPALGLSAPCEPALLGAGVTEVDVADQLVGLAPGRRYYYQLSATNEVRTVTSDDEGTFETEPLGNGLPALGRCVPAAQAAVGLYKNSDCTKSPATGKTGKYEWGRWPITKHGFAAAGDALTLETSAKTAVTCSASQASGEYDGPTSANLTITLTGCEAKGAITGKCQSEGEAAGEIKTAALTGQLGTITAGSKPTVGWDLTPATGANIATPTCGSAAISIHGSAIAPVKSIDKMASTFTLELKGKKGKQTPESFEGGAKDTLTLKTPASSEPIGLTGTLTITGEEAIEIKAIE